jgi:hypothetical protein
LVYSLAAIIIFAPVTRTPANFVPMLKSWIKNFLGSEKAPRAVIIFLLVFYCATNFYHRNWIRDEGPQRGVIKWDIISYYAYLPAVFIYHDIGLDFTEDPGFVNDDKFWFQETGIGKKLIITSMGMAYLYSPFFFMAHALAPVFGEPRDGFQSIYQFFLVFSALFYVAIGLICLWKLLSRYFPPGVTALSLLPCSWSLHDGMTVRNGNGGSCWDSFSD